MMLSDKDLRELSINEELVTPFIQENCEGATINLTLGSTIKKYKSSQEIVMGNKLSDNEYEEINIKEHAFSLEPGESILIQSNEYFKIPDDKAAQILERYSVKLLGLLISPGSYMNPGYEGKMSFVAFNQSPVPIRLIPGIKFAQVAIYQLSSVSEKPYREQDAKYLGSKEINISKLHLDQEIQEFLLSKGVSRIPLDTSKELGDYLLDKIDTSAQKIALELREKFGDPNAG